MDHSDIAGRVGKVGVMSLSPGWVIEIDRRSAFRWEWYVFDEATSTSESGIASTRARATEAARDWMRDLVLARS